MATRSHQIAFLRVTSTGTKPLYTVPANTVVILKSAILSNWGSVAAAEYIDAKKPAGSPSLHYAAVQVDPGSSFHHEFWMVLEAGDIVEVSAGSVPSDFFLFGTILPANLA